MEKEMELRRKVVELEQEKVDLVRDNTELRERLQGLYGEYQVLQYVIQNSPTGQDLLLLQGKIKKLERILEEEVPGWQFLLGKEGKRTKEEDNTSQMTVSG